jgi:acetate kinase
MPQERAAQVQPVTLRSDRRRILSIDRGSSSLKVAVYELGPSYENLLLDGGIEQLETPGVALRLRDYRAGAPYETCRPLGDSTPINALLAFLAEVGVRVDAVGHRLVFGGSTHEAPARVNAALLNDLAKLVPFDPLHLPAALAAIGEIETDQPDLAQVVCFDTAFHRRMPAVAQRFPLPRELWSEGVRRYGFHGLSYESIVCALGDRARGMMIVAHLGSGASLAAMRDGKPVDTTMGFSALGGLMMGTRPGDLDPGALLYLLRIGRYTLADLDDVLWHHSGLLGVSQMSPAMQTLLERRGADATAAEAVELFVYEAKKHIGALCAALGGLDAFVFTGGIGERSAAIRSEIAAGLAHLGIELDPLRNEAGTGVISPDGARVVVHVIPARENLMVARHTYTTLFGWSDGDRPASPSDAVIYPWRLDPKLASARWGGDELVRTYGKDGDPNDKLGESWECWDANTVANGPLKGSSLALLRERLGKRFLGDLDPARRFPTLTKIITAHDWLSVQVHPNDAYAQRVEHQPFGKTECWYVLAAERNAELVVGWLRDTSRAEYEHRVADGTLADILRKVPVKAGDSVYVPAGLVHAIGPGIAVFETQQASDLTYRMFDWNRMGLDGKPRELQVQKAADVLDYRAGGETTLLQVAYRHGGLQRTALVADPRFTVERIVATRESGELETNGRPLIMMSLEQPMQVGCGGTSTELRKYQTVVIPAAAGCCTVRSGETSAPFLMVTPERSPDQASNRLLAAGIPAPQVAAFTEQFLQRRLVA